METPERIIKLREKLHAEWADDNVVSVGSGYAKKSLPDVVDGVHIRFSDIPMAL